MNDLCDQLWLQLLRAYTWHYYPCPTVDQLRLMGYVRYDRETGETFPF